MCSCYGRSCTIDVRAYRAQVPAQWYHINDHHRLAGNGLNNQRPARKFDNSAKPNKSENLSSRTCVCAWVSQAGITTNCTYRFRAHFSSAYRITKYGAQHKACCNINIYYWTVTMHWRSAQHHYITIYYDILAWYFSAHSTSSECRGSTKKILAKCIRMYDIAHAYWHMWVCSASTDRQ